MKHRESPPLEIVYQDDRVLVVNKPSGLIVHRGWGHDRVTVMSLLRDQLETTRSLHPVGRLDRGASGALLCALDPDAARELSAAAQDGEVTKQYLALVRGAPPEHGSIDHPIPRRPGGPRVPALSDYRMLQTVETEPRTTSLVLVTPRSGRLHQVRRHLKHISHPLIGDANYGKGALNRAMARGYGLRRLALHARSLSFPRPGGEGSVELRAPVPADLGGPLGRMGYGDNAISG